MKPRIPWIVKRSAYLLCQHVRSYLSRLRPKKTNTLNISFFCEYQQQTTGASVAIACIANTLSQQYNVDAVTKPYSGYSKLLGLKVTQYWHQESIDGQIIFVDIEQKTEVVAQLVGEGKTVVLTCHAFPLQLHSVPQPELTKSLSLSNYIHFVSEHQRSQFIKHYPKIDIVEKSFVVPNFTRQSRKQSNTSNIGIIGFLNRENKNALAGIKLAQKSNAQSIQCWGSNEIYGIDTPSDYSKLQINGWADDTMEMHNSFDVLLSPSKFETFGLIVVEALSAGIPCVLSDIPVYRELYSDCKGVAFLTGDEQKNIETINQFLEQGESLKQDIINFWQQQFSNETIAEKWFETIEKIQSEQH